MTNDILALSKKLISLKSTPDNKQALDECLNICLSYLRGFTIEHFEKNGFKSVLVYNTNKRPKRFRLILNGHLDIIPGKDFQYTPEIKGNRLYGASAMDMKAPLACLITVFREIAKKINYPLALQIVTDEELGGFYGTKYQIDKGVRGDFILVGEATQLEIENKTKGIIWAKISAKGKTAHGAYPWKGENAIWKINQFLNNLAQKYPTPHEPVWKTTVNLSYIETTNKTFNKIPDDCTLSLDIRYAPEDSDTIINNLKEILPKGLRLQLIVHEPAQFTPENNNDIQQLRKKIKKVIEKKGNIISAMGSSDLRHFTRVKCPGVEFGCIGKGMGSDNEWVDIKSLENYYQILKSFLLDLK